MRHITPQEGAIEALLRSTRTVAVIGASPRAERHSNQVVSYLHKTGYDVVPVRPDRAQVQRLPTYARLDDFGGSVDLVVIFRRPDAVPAHIREAAAKHADAVWLPPGAWSREAEDEARALHVQMVKDCCIIEEHRHLTAATGEPAAGHPRKQGVHVHRRRRSAEDIEERGPTPPNPGYAARGGGGHKAGGGKRSVLDERKMTNRRR